jgi:hypothetical protein
MAASPFASLKKWALRDKSMQGKLKDSETPRILVGRSSKLSLFASLLYKEGLV